MITTIRAWPTYVRKQVGFDLVGSPNVGKESNGGTTAKTVRLSDTIVSAAMAASSSLSNFSIERMNLAFDMVRSSMDRARDQFSLAYDSRGNVYFSLFGSRPKNYSLSRSAITIITATWIIEFFKTRIHDVALRDYLQAEKSYTLYEDASVASVVRSFLSDISKVANAAYDLDVLLADDFVSHGAKDLKQMSTLIDEFAKLWPALNKSLLSARVFNDEGLTMVYVASMVADQVSRIFQPKFHDTLTTVKSVLVELPKVISVFNDSFDSVSDAMIKLYTMDLWQKQVVDPVLSVKDCLKQTKFSIGFSKTVLTLTFDRLMKPVFSVLSQLVLSRVYRDKIKQRMASILSKKIWLWVESERKKGHSNDVTVPVKMITGDDTALAVLAVGNASSSVDFSARPIQGLKDESNVNFEETEREVESLLEGCGDFYRYFNQQINTLYNEASDNDLGGCDIWFSVLTGGTRSLVGVTRSEVKTNSEFGLATFLTVPAQKVTDQSLRAEKVVEDSQSQKVGDNGTKAFELLSYSQSALGVTRKRFRPQMYQVNASIVNKLSAEKALDYDALGSISPLLSKTPSIVSSNIELPLILLMARGYCVEAVSDQGPLSPTGASAMKVSLGHRIDLVKPLIAEKSTSKVKLPAQLSVAGDLSRFEPLSGPCDIAEVLFSLPPVSRYLPSDVETTVIQRLLVLNAMNDWQERPVQSILSGPRNLASQRFDAFLSSGADGAKDVLSFVRTLSVPSAFTFSEKKVLPRRFGIERSESVSDVWRRLFRFYLPLAWDRDNELLRQVLHFNGKLQIGRRSTPTDTYYKTTVRLGMVTSKGLSILTFQAANPKTDLELNAVQEAIGAINASVKAAQEKERSESTVNDNKSKGGESNDSKSDRDVLGPGSGKAKELFEQLGIAFENNVDPQFVPGSYGVNLNSLWFVIDAKLDPKTDFVWSDPAEKIYTKNRIEGGLAYAPVIKDAIRGGSGLDQVLSASISSEIYRTDTKVDFLDRSELFIPSWVEASLTSFDDPQSNIDNLLKDLPVAWKVGVNLLLQVADSCLLSKAKGYAFGESSFVTQSPSKVVRYVDAFNKGVTSILDPSCLSLYALGLPSVDSLSQFLKTLKEAMKLFEKGQTADLHSWFNKYSAVSFETMHEPRLATCLNTLMPEKFWYDLGAMSPDVVNLTQPTLVRGVQNMALAIFPAEVAEWIETTIVDQVNEFCWRTLATT